MGLIGNDRRERLTRMRLYLVTGEAGGIEETCRVVQAALEGGVDLVQLRKKLMPKGEQYYLGRSLRRLTTEFGALLIINDHADIAQAVDADGVHLGQEDLDLLVTRHLPGFAARVIGCSTHSIEQALLAAAQGADYLGVGPVYATPTKPGRPAVGLQLVRGVAAAINKPFVAIGGIDASNIAEVVTAGARAVAVVRAVYDAPDPSASAMELREQVEAGLRVRA